MFVGMILFWILSLFFLGSAISGQFQNMQIQLPQGGKGGFNMNPKDIDNMFKDAAKNAPKIDADQQKQIEEAMKKALENFPKKKN